MADYYKVLGLDGPPNDLKTVKKAYAKALRSTRPDDDPNGFMKLREAYTFAKQDIAYREANADDINAEQDSSGDVAQDLQSADITPDGAEQITDKALSALLEDTPPDNKALPEASDEQPEEIELTGDQILMSRLMKAYKDPFLKNDKAHWGKILDDKADLSIDEYLDFDSRLRNALIDTYNQWIEDKAKDKSKRRPFPSTIENLIFDKMEWRFLQEADSYKSQQIEWLKSQMDLFNRPAPKHIRQAREMNQTQVTEFEDDDESLWTFIWRIIRVILIFLVISQVFKLFT